MSTGLVLRAEDLARRAHGEQKDKAGAPYILHPGRVARRMEVSHAGWTLWTLQAIAWLHDVVEDTWVTLDRLVELDFPERVVTAVDALTRRSGEEPESYYRRVRADSMARVVKIADIADNTDPRRLSFLGPPTVTRLIKKYARALDALDVPEGEG